MTAPSNEKEILEQLTRTLEEQPFARLVGTKITHVERGRVELTVENRPELAQQAGFLHGGVIGYLADNSCAFAAGTVRPEGAAGLVTSEYKVNILRPATGTRVIARSEIVRAGRIQCVAEARIYCDEGGEEKLVAIALATLVYVYGNAKAV